MGQPVPSQIQKLTLQRIQNYNKVERSPEPYIKIISQTTLDTADMNDTVGRNLMAISLPRAGLEKNGSS